MYYFLLQAGLMALILGSIQAQGLERYPAADFQPRVLYQAQAEASGAETAVLDAEYPAASFTPQVVFQDPELIETTGPLPPTADLSSQAAPIQSVGAIPAKGARPSSKSTGAISDVTPPYGALGLAVAVIVLAFWWAIRQKPATMVAAGSNLTAPAPGDSGQESLEAGEDLEELAVEVEEALATTNRQRAGKTKRTRRR